MPKKFCKGFTFFFALIVTFSILSDYFASFNYNPIISEKSYWDKESFWFHPWGVSGVHKGVDIFSERGSKVLAPGMTTVVSTGYGLNAGNYIYLLCPSGKIYYYAHLDTSYAKPFRVFRKHQSIGTVGNTGNANNGPPHLHFSIMSLVPHIFKYDRNAAQGWKKMFYLDPSKYID